MYGHFSGVPYRDAGTDLESVRADASDLGGGNAQKQSISLETNYHGIHMIHLDCQIWTCMPSQDKPQSILLMDTERGQTMSELSLRRYDDAC